ncbi:MAG: hypothetical protein ACRD2U_03075 [Terriglobales bacterium]
MPITGGKWRLVCESAVVVLILSIYAGPSFRTRAELGSKVLPPIFGPDLTLYLNLSEVRAIGGNQVLDPYYHLPVRDKSTAYLKFSLATRLFGELDRALSGRIWTAVLMWDALWWGLLSGIALWVFKRNLPTSPPGLAIAYVALLMLVNVTALKPLAVAWFHLPSLWAFQKLNLPFMRAFFPVIPSCLVLAYVGLQIEALRRNNLILWAAMGVLQLIALGVFPFATLMMAGLTGVSVVCRFLSARRSRDWQIPLAYGLTCAFLDGGFLWHSSLSVNENQPAALHLQPELLPHLIGGSWALLVALTIAMGFSKTLVPEVKWTLAGLGATNAAMLLGDALVPATKIQLSQHAGYFVQLTIVTLAAFIAAAGRNVSRVVTGALWVALGIILLNGVFSAIGAYRGFLPANCEIAGLSRLPDKWMPGDGDLVIARSRNVDDDCGWMVLLTKTPVLYCTDAKLVLEPQQDRDIHRLRQALYLYFTGQDSNSLERELAGPDPSPEMHRLGYWAAAASLSTDERNQGIHDIQTELIPRLEQVARHDAAVDDFFHQFRRVVVIDHAKAPTFNDKRLASLLNFEKEQTIGDLVLLYYTPR